jgi:hypothetical protein
MIEQGPSCFTKVNEDLHSEHFLLAFIATNAYQNRLPVLQLNFMSPNTGQREGGLLPKITALRSFGGFNVD